MIVGGGPAAESQTQLRMQGDSSNPPGWCWQAFSDLVTQTCSYFWPIVNIKGMAFGWQDLEAMDRTLWPRQSHAAHRPSDELPYNHERMAQSSPLRSEGS